MALRIAPLSLLCNSVVRGFRRTVSVVLLPVEKEHPVPTKESRIVSAAVAEAMAKDPTLTSVNQAMSNLTLPFVGKWCFCAKIPSFAIALLP